MVHWWNTVKRPSVALTSTRKPCCSSQGHQPGRCAIMTARVAYMGTSKEGKGLPGVQVSFPLPLLLCLILPSATCLLWWTENKELSKSFSCLPGNSLLPCADLNLASRCPSTQKDHMRGAYLEEINAYFKLIFKAWIMSSREKGGWTFILSRYIQFSGVKKQ